MQKRLQTMKFGSISISWTCHLLQHLSVFVALVSVFFVLSVLAGRDAAVMRHVASPLTVSSDLIRCPSVSVRVHCGVNVDCLSVVVDDRKHDYHIYTLPLFWSFISF